MPRMFPAGSSSPRGTRWWSRSPGRRCRSSRRGTQFAGCLWTRRGNRSPRRMGLTLPSCCPSPCRSRKRTCRRKTGTRRWGRPAKRCPRRRGWPCRRPSPRGKRTPAGTRPASCWPPRRRKSSPPCTATRRSWPTQWLGTRQRGTGWSTLSEPRASQRGKSSQRGTGSRLQRRCPRGKSNPRGMQPAACWPWRRSSRSPLRKGWSLKRCWRLQGSSQRRTQCRSLRTHTCSRQASTCPRGTDMRWPSPCLRGSSSPRRMPPA